VNSDAYANEVELPPHLFGITPEAIRAMKFIPRAKTSRVTRTLVSRFAEDGSGRQTLISRWPDGLCNDNALFKTPMAWVEREGEVCWIVRIGYEDGEAYQVIPPDRLGGEGGNACSIR
jgi:hypothetical protein